VAAADLYHAAIVGAARAARGAGRLHEPDASVRVDNPLCGDRVSVDVCLREGRISALAHRVKGCLLCEAAASIIGAHGVGESEESLARVGEALGALLRGEAPADSLPWQELGVFAPVSAYPSRHRCVLLAFEALSQALAEARGKFG
jgi:nitrogen fixation NifU-like protein